MIFAIKSKIIFLHFVNAVHFYFVSKDICAAPIAAIFRVASSLSKGIKVNDRNQIIITKIGVVFSIGTYLRENMNWKGK